jgi:hypothetical protein
MIAVPCSPIEPETIGAEALLEHERGGQGHRPRAGHRQIVDRAVHRQLPDRAAREADRLDDEAVRRDREHPNGSGVLQLLDPERGRQQALDERQRRLPARAVCHRDPLVAEAERPRADALDQVEGALLGHTTTRSRMKRPKL